MIELKETKLPGLGLRHDFLAETGERVGVLSHRDGRKDIYVYSVRDPDACRSVLSLTPEESEAMADLLGGTRVTRNLGDLQQEVEGLGIDWLPLPPGSPYAGRSLGDTRVRSRTGASVVAVIRDGTAVPSPNPAYRLEAGDTLVVIGTPDGLAGTAALLCDG